MIIQGMYVDDTIAIHVIMDNCTNIDIMQEDIIYVIANYIEYIYRCKLRMILHDKRCAMFETGHLYNQELTHDQNKWNDMNNIIEDVELLVEHSATKPIILFMMPSYTLPHHSDKLEKISSDADIIILAEYPDFRFMDMKFATTFSLFINSYTDTINTEPANKLLKHIDALVKERIGHTSLKNDIKSPNTLCEALYLLFNNDLSHYNDMVKLAFSNQDTNYMMRMGIRDILREHAQQPKNDCIIDQFRKLASCVKTSNPKDMSTHVRAIIDNAHNIELTDKEEDILDEFDHIDRSKLNTSQIISQTAFTDWTEEIDVESCMGLLVRVRTTQNVQKVPLYVVLENASVTYVSVSDYIETINKGSIGSLAEIEGMNGIDMVNGNIIIPLYINKYHWVYARRYIDYMMGIMVTNNPFIHTPSNTKHMFALMIMISRTYTHESDNIAVIILHLVRTCAQLAKEMGYSRGIRTLIDKIIQNPDTFSLIGLNHAMNILGQIICTGARPNHDKLMNIITIMTNSIVNKIMKRNKECISIYNNKEAACIPNYMNNAYIMCMIMNKVYNECGGYNKFLIRFDKHNGHIDKSLIDIYRKNAVNPQHISDKIVSIIDDKVKKYEKNNPNT